jgi:hypothetical protein
MEKSWGLAYAIIFVTDALYTYVENIIQNTHVHEAKDVAVPHVHKV